MYKRISNDFLAFCSIAGGELFEKIIAKEYLTEKEAVCYLRQLLEGLAYMHSKSIVHLDIKVSSTEGKLTNVTITLRYITNGDLK